jgi:uncharacterized membrane-anchored protein
VPTIMNSEAHSRYNRVPKVTADFWLIKLMAVTMGETAADYINVQMGLGLTTTSLLMSAVLLGSIPNQRVEVSRQIMIPMS